MTTTPKLGIPLISSQQNQPEVTHNAMVLLVQAVLGGAIAQQNAPPGSPDDGDCYVVGAAGTGAWNDHDNAIAIFFGGWNFLPGVDDDGVQIVMGADQAGLELTIAGVPSVWDGTAWAAAGGGGASATDLFTDIPLHPGWDPRFAGAVGQYTLSNNNKTARPTSGGPYNHIMGTPARFTGKRYFEMVAPGMSFAALGICGSAGHLKNGDGNAFGAYFGQMAWNAGGTVTGSKQPGTSQTVATVDGYTQGDTLCFAIDFEAGLIWFRKNALLWNNDAGANPATGTNGISLYWALAGAGNGLIWPAGNSDDTGHDLNLFLLAADWAQAAPSGFVAWAT
jgi:hypothetical protein